MGMVWNTDVLIGTQLGSCTLERLIGIGGMSAVYLAEQDHPHRQVAVKVVHPPQTMGAEAHAQFLARFRHEADAAAALDHANIVPIYEFGEDSALAYLVMPYLANGSLADLLAHEGAFPIRYVVNYTEQIAAALDYSHAHGIVHRDVKPSNLLLHPDGRLLLADFGVARMAKDSTGDATMRRPNIVWGTPEYMAPEQIMGEQITAATDIYELGIVAYALLTGQPPFVGESTEDVLRQQLQVPPLPVRALCPDVPARVEEVVHWALAKQPSERPASAGTFARALKEAAMESEASVVASQRRLDRLAASVQPLARTLTRLILGSTPNPSAAPRVSATSVTRPALDSSATQHPNLSASALQPTGGQSPTLPMARPQTVAEPDQPTTPRQRGATARSTDLSRIVLPILIAILVFLLAITRGFAKSDIPLLILGDEPANGTPVTAADTASGESVALTWLGVSPDHLDLDCSNNRTAEITLRNRGPEQMLWRVNIAFLDGISVSPAFGSLESGESVTIVVTNASRIFAHNNTLTLKPLLSKAGRPVVVTYTTTPCWLGMAAPNTQT